MDSALRTLYKTAKDERGGAMTPTDAARIVGISPRTVFRFLKAGKAMTPEGFVSFAKDHEGNVSASQLGCIKALRETLPRAGRKYGTHQKNRRSRSENGRGGRVIKKGKDDLWRLQRILAMIDNVTDKNTMIRIRSFAAQKYHRL